MAVAHYQGYIQQLCGAINERHRSLLNILFNFDNALLED